MHNYWVSFKGFPSMCVEAADEAEAKKIGLEHIGREVVKVESLPYPAKPRLTRHIYPQHGVCPSFCFDPEKCKGNTACPKSYSCVE